MDACHVSLELGPFPLTRPLSIGRTDRIYRHDRRITPGGCGPEHEFYRIELAS